MGFCLRINKFHNPTFVTVYSCCWTLVDCKDIEKFLTWFFNTHLLGRYEKIV